MLARSTCVEAIVDNGIIGLDLDSKIGGCVAFFVGSETFTDLTVVGYV